MILFQKSRTIDNQKFFRIFHKKHFTQVQNQQNDSISSSTFYRQRHYENNSRDELAETASNHNIRRRKKIINNKFDLFDQTLMNSFSNANFINVRKNVIVTINVLTKYKTNRINVKQFHVRNKKSFNQLVEQFSRIQKSMTQRSQNFRFIKRKITRFERIK